MAKRIKKFGKKSLRLGGKEETPYCYYVCYQSLKGGQSQVSCSIIKRAHLIDSEKEVGDLVQFLLRVNQLQAVIPINWILLAPGMVHPQDMSTKLLHTRARMRPR